MRKQDPHRYDAEIEELTKTISKYKNLAKQAASKAAGDMPPVINAMNDSDQKMIIMERHAEMIGIAMAFTGGINELVSEMPGDLQSMGLSEESAEVLTEIFLAKVFTNIFDELHK